MLCIMHEGIMVSALYYVDGCFVKHEDPANLQSGDTVEQQNFT